MNRFRSFFALLILGSVIGCSTGPAENVIEVNAPTPEENIRKVLNGVIETGEPLGSGGYVLQQEIDAIKVTDPAKAAALQPHYDKIISLDSPGPLKAKAKEMLDAL